MLGVALPTLLGISRGMEPCGMTPWLSLTSSVYGKYATIIISRMTALTISLLLQSHQGRSLRSRSPKADCTTWTQLVHNTNNDSNKDTSLQ